MNRPTPLKTHQPARLLSCLVVCGMTLFFLVANGSPAERPYFESGIYEVLSDCSGEEVIGEVDFTSSEQEKLQAFGIDNFFAQAGKQIAEVNGREVICEMIAYEDLDLYFFDCRAVDNGEPICTITMR